MNHTGWEALAERCEKAPWADRKIDEDILKGLGYDYDAVADCQWAWVDRDGGIVAASLPLTKSLGDITAFILDELPDAKLTLVTSKTYSSALLRYRWRRDTWYETKVHERKDGEAALAACAAFCNAMATRGLL